MSIAEEIRAFAKNGNECLTHSADGLGTMPAPFTTYELMAFEKSHARLLEAAKRFVEKGVWYNVSRDTDTVDDNELDLLRTAIEEAEQHQGGTQS